MPTYVVLAHFTDQGIRNIKESPKPEDAFRELCEKMGAPTVRPCPVLSVPEGNKRAFRGRRGGPVGRKSRVGTLMGGV